jgi:hypothetical protein
MASLVKSRPKLSRTGVFVRSGFFSDAADFCAGLEDLPLSIF